MTARTALRSWAPSAAATAEARMMPGKAKTTSAMRMMTESTIPEKNPAIAPRAEPIAIATAHQQDGQWQREAGAVQDPAEHVAAELVGPEQVEVRRRRIEGAELEVRWVRAPARGRRWRSGSRRG